MSCDTDPGGGLLQPLFDLHKKAAIRPPKKEQQQQLWYQVRTRVKPRRANPFALSLKTVKTTVFIPHFFFFFFSLLLA